VKLTVILVESKSTDAAYYFAVEELFTRYIRLNEPVLMLWQTKKTVMLGSNQVVEAEVDVEFALESAIQIVRRSSGGGAIYTDLGTVLYTVIKPLLDETKTVREEVAASVISALHKMGVPAVREGKNDLLLEGKKISGFAQYTSGSHVCTHGSLLFDTDLDTLTDVLIANEGKLQPKGIASIRSRVTNIKPYIKKSISVEGFINELKDLLLEGTDHTTHELSHKENELIKRIYNEKYTDQEWNLRM
jgi:lipoate-protein ligase A